MDIDLGSISYYSNGNIVKKIITESIDRNKIKREIEYYVSFVSSNDKQQYIKKCDNNILISKDIK